MYNMDGMTRKDEDIEQMTKGAIARRTNKVTMELDGDTILLWQKIPYAYRSAVTRASLRFFFQSEEAKERYRGVWPTFIWMALWGEQPGLPVPIKGQ